MDKLTRMFCSPYVTKDKFVVDSIDMGNYETRTTAFPVYPNTSFDYEIPDNQCLPPGELYAASDSYFPGRQTYRTRLDTERGVLYKPGCKVSWCPKKFWNQGEASIPTIPLGCGPVYTRHPAYLNAHGPLVDGPNILNDFSVNADLRTGNAVPSFPIGGVRSLGGGSKSNGGGKGGKGSEPLTLPDVPLGGPIGVQEQLSDGGFQLDMISPGGQDTRRHWGVHDNRYSGQKGKTNIYIRDDATGFEPYTNSLYQSPYDATKNMISTGKLVNPYTQETFETFENQLPPPNTDKGSRPAYQYKQANPKLIYAMGGWNNHNPVPRKKEQPGFVFNPVNARGGSNPFGDAVYAPKIQERIQDQVMRSVYNNRDGDQVVEPSLVGERPKNMFGLVPRIRFNPYLAPTNELDRCGYVSIPENQGTDLTKREEYTGEWFNRKNHLLVHRDPYPTTFVNGVEAISWIPIATEHTGPMRADLEQSYIGVGHLNIGNTTQTVMPAEMAINKSRVSEGQTNPIPSGATVDAGGGTLVSQASIRRTAQSIEENTKPVGHATSLAQGAIHSAKEISKQSKKLVVTKQVQPPDMHSSIAGTLILPSHTLKMTQKGTISQTRAGADMRELPNVGIIMSDANLRGTQKITDSFQVLNTDNNFGNNMIYSDTNLRDTQKNTDSFQILNTDNVFGNNMIYSDTNLRDTQKLEQMLPIGNVNGIDGVVSGIIVTDQEVRATLKTAYAENPFRTAANPGLDTAGDIMTQLATIRPSQKGIIANAAFPMGPVFMPDASQNMIIDREPWQKKCSQKAGVQGYYMGISGDKQGAQSLIMPDVTSIQHRGQCKQLYLPSMSLVPEEANGTSVRTVQGLNRNVRFDVEASYQRESLPQMPEIPGGNRSMFPSVRGTMKADTSSNELSSAMCDA
jgi:hypothetical protein